jgi:hypothetical protein
MPRCALGLIIRIDCLNGSELVVATSEEKQKKLELILSASDGECLALHGTASYDMHKVRRAIKTSVTLKLVIWAPTGLRAHVGSPQRFVSRESVLSQFL